MADEPRNASLWGRLDLPTRVIASLAAVVGGIATLLALLWGIFTVIWGNPFSVSDTQRAVDTNPSVVALKQIAKCEAAHRLGAASVVRYGRYMNGTERILFERCLWPPGPGADVDGYERIVDEDKSIPGKVAADRFSEVDHFVTQCDVVQASYVLDHMSSRLFRNAALLPGHLVGAEVTYLKKRIGIRAADLARTPYYVSIPLPTERGFYDLRSGHIGVADAQCVG